MRREDFIDTEFLFSENAVFIEEIYEKYLKNPTLVDFSWQEYFRSNYVKFELARTKTSSKIIDIDSNLQNSQPLSTKSNLISNDNSNIDIKASMILSSYRQFGHYLASLDPLNLVHPLSINQVHLDLEAFDLKESQLDCNVSLNDIFLNNKNFTLNALIDNLHRIYSSNSAIEYNKDILALDEAKYLFNNFESYEIHLSNEDRIGFLTELVRTEGFEQYIHSKLPGAKRFSIEGADNVVPTLNYMQDIFVKNGVCNLMIGMAHRGRLNVLSNVLKKPYAAIFSEFKGNPMFPKEYDISGDVKYHMGYTNRRTVDQIVITTSLAPNPSHLEAIDPILLGTVRAQLDLSRSGGDVSENTNVNQACGILIHGDAAFCGQGVVSETLILSTLKAYSIDGVIHIVINNQIGFTTDTEGGRSSRYATDIAKAINAPILHVNGDDLEEVLRIASIATNYRNKFKKDIIIDIVCYRKYGHNEGDEPLYTQSLMYQVIKDKQTPGALYAQKLEQLDIIDKNYFTKLKTDFKATLDESYELAANYSPDLNLFNEQWKKYKLKIDNNLQIKTGVAKEILRNLAFQICNIPDNFALNPKLKKLFDNRINSISKDEPIDWATAESLAFATLLNEQVPIRLAGQDSQRGTFSHRHSVLHSQDSDATYTPLNHLSDNQAVFRVYNSNLSEYAALGFEYGYSIAHPNHLVLWEAQFGDFCNGAQIIFDQFISSAEEKWLQRTGIVVLLPHGFEGQGPEHSSARLERFLQLCAQDNMIVAYPTTPASIFHLLRRQIYANYRKPLIIMTPKSLLRHKLAVSNMSDLDENTEFSTILDESNLTNKTDSNSITKIILCSGKIYYDLYQMREESKLENVTILRFEQLYPLDCDLLSKYLKKYKNAKKFIWCQEEPKNMGAWCFIKNQLDGIVDLEYIGRDSSASPAVGRLAVHNEQQEKILKEALEIK
ncbi:MAG: 2-oxoglutarate dehydrogenase E1 component [Rickettsiaceae bacterium]